MILEKIYRYAHGNPNKQAIVYKGKSLTYAELFKEINLTNINNKQKVALANQAAALQIGLADLNARQQTALQNSSNGFKLQSQSLSNMQQTALANAQLKASLQEMYKQHTISQ